MPHQHSNEIEDTNASEVISNADDFLDYIQVLFLTDLGEGHMESFDQGEQFDFASNMVLESNAETIPFIEFISDSKQIFHNHLQQTNCPEDDPFIRRYLLSHIEFRGPPIQA